MPHQTKVTPGPDREPHHPSENNIGRRLHTSKWLLYGQGKVATRRALRAARNHYIRQRAIGRQLRQSDSARALPPSLETAALPPEIISHAYRISAGWQWTHCAWSRRPLEMTRTQTPLPPEIINGFLQVKTLPSFPDHAAVSAGLSMCPAAETSFLTFNSTFVYGVITPLDIKLCEICTGSAPFYPKHIRLSGP